MESGTMHPVGEGAGKGAWAEPSHGLPSLDPDELVRKGRSFAENLPASADEQAVDERRAEIREYAAALVDRAILDMGGVSDAEIQALKSQLETEKNQVPYWKDARDQAWRELNGLRQERGTLGEEPKQPNLRLFLAVGTALGLAFGLVGATTVGDILFTLFPTDSPAVRQRLFVLGFVISLFIGLIVGLGAILVRRWAVGAGFLGRWGPLLGGFFLAAGLGGYRLIHEDATGVVTLRLTAVGLVLSFVEVAILIVIAVLDDVLLASWERWETGRVEIARKEEQIRRAAEELERREEALAKEERDVERARALLREALAKRRRSEQLRENRDRLVESVARQMLAAFEREWDRRRAAGGVG